MGVVPTHCFYNTVVLLFLKEYDKFCKSNTKLPTSKSGYNIINNTTSLELEAQCTKA